MEIEKNGEFCRIMIEAYGRCIDIEHNNTIYYLYSKARSSIVIGDQEYVLRNSECRLFKRMKLKILVLEDVLCFTCLDVFPCFLKTDWLKHGYEAVK